MGEVPRVHEGAELRPGVDVMDFDLLFGLVAEAGKAILDCDQEVPSPGKELSLYDRAFERAYKVLLRGLRSCCGDIPVISKVENAAKPTGEALSRYWLAHPLDGLFGGGSIDFTVDLALIENDVPVLGLVYAPVQKTFYFAAKGDGCWKMDEGARQRLTVSAPPKGAPVRVIISRSHPSPDVLLLIDVLPSSVTMGRDSALRFCAIAEGRADLYPQLDLTRAWETAAGQIIVTEAGGVMIDSEGKPFRYSNADFVNGPFLVAPGSGWLEEMGLREWRKSFENREYDFCAKSCR